MALIKVLLCLTPRFFREVLGDVIGHQPDMQVVGTLSQPRKLMAGVAQTGATALVVPLQGGDGVPGHYEDLLLEYPDLTIVAVSADRAVTYRRSICAEEITEATRGKFLDALRTAKRAE